MKITKCDECNKEIRTNKEIKIEYLEYFMSRKELIQRDFCSFDCIIKYAKKEIKENQKNLKFDAQLIKPHIY